MRHTLFCLIMIVIIISCGRNETNKKGDTALDSVQAAINEALDYHTAASNSYDLKACMEMFTDDASVIEYLETVKKLNGKAEIDSSVALELVEFKKANMKFDVKWKTNSLRLAGDKAYHDASVAYTITSTGADPVKVSAETMMVWKKAASGKWQVQTFILYAN